MSIEIKMAWRNLWRNPRRTVLSAAAIAFAGTLLVFMLSWQFGAYESMINSSVKINTGHLQIQAKGYQENSDIRLEIPDPESLISFLEKLGDVEAYTSRAIAFSLASSEDRTYGAAVVGIDPDQEVRVSTIKRMIRKGSYLSSSDTNQALVGKLLARNLSAGVGDELTLLGQGLDGSIAATVVQVKGIYSSGMDEFDRSSIQLPLNYFQTVYTMRGGVHKIVVNVKSLDCVSAVKKRIAEKLTTVDSKKPLVVLDWKELNPGLVQSITMDLASGAIFYLILIIVSGFSIMNTFLMSVFERTKEFGVLMAIGTAPGRLIKVLLIESTLLTLAGVVISMVSGAAITLYFQIHGFDFAGASELLNQYGVSGRMYTRLTPVSLLAGPITVMAVTFITALPPAMRIRRLKIVEAISFQ